MDDEKKPLKIDLGCGPNKKGPEWTGVDRISFPGVDVVCDLTKRWPWDDNSVDEAHSSHFIEHLDGPERVHFANELCRVLKPGAKALLIAPDWSSGRAYGDMTHKFPPIDAFWLFYLNKEWRKTNAPHDDVEWNPNGYSCNFGDPVWFYTIRPEIGAKNQAMQQYAVENYKNACMDLVATLTKPT